MDWRWSSNFLRNSILAKDCKPINYRLSVLFSRSIFHPSEITSLYRTSVANKTLSVTASKSRAKRRSAGDDSKDSKGNLIISFYLQPRNATISHRRKKGIFCPRAMESNIETVREADELNATSKMLLIPLLRIHCNMFRMCCLCIRETS